MPALFKMQSDRLTEYMLTGASLFFVGALVGSIRRDRVWRWGAAAFLGYLIVDVAQLPYEKTAALAYSDVLLSLASRAPTHLLLSVPVMAGAYVGSGLTKAGLR